MSNFLPTIEFDKIIARNGSRRKAFEELAVLTLAVRLGNDFVRICGDGGDDGIEAYWIKKNKKLIALQAKYLFTLKNKKSQFEKSFFAAVKKYSNLSKYIFVVPFNHTPEQRVQWDEWVINWQQWAKQNLEINVKIEWCGESRLHRLLFKDETIIKYYFGYASFNNNWLKTKLEDTIELLDIRYTPDINIETNTFDKLSAFVGLSEFRNKYYDAARKVCEALNRLDSEFQIRSQNTNVKQDQKVTQLFVELWKFCLNFSEQLGDEKFLPDFNKIRVCLNDFSKPLDELIQLLNFLDQKENPNRKFYEDGAWTSRYNAAHNFRTTLRRFICFLDDYSYWGKKFLLLTGEAGSGKSHLLADIAKKLLSRDSPCIMVLGEIFVSSNDLWKQFSEYLNWDHDIESLLGLLEAKAKKNQTLGFIFIDAINESDNKKLWQTLATKFSSRLDKYPTLRLVLSCRTDFLKICLPDSITEAKKSNWSKLVHRGFDINMFEAVKEFFRKYHVKSEHFPPYFPEFSNPLFLKVLCETYKDQYLPTNSIVFSKIFFKHKARIQKEVSKKLGCYEITVEKAINIIVKEMVKQKRSRIQVAPIITKINNLVPVAEENKGLYAHLRSSGLFFEIGAANEADTQIRFSFDRFYDFFVANEIISKFNSLNEAKASLEKSGILYGFLDSHQTVYENSGLIRALSILFPERFKIEFSSLSSNPSDSVKRAFVESFKWRKIESINVETENLFWKYNKSFFPGLFYDLIQLAAVPKHPFNADWMHGFLKSKSMHQRDLSWTQTISDYSCEEEKFVSHYFLHWAKNVPIENVSQEQARLAGIMLGWFFSCTRIQFRNEATTAAIRLLTPHPQAVCQLIESFSDINDPYILERIYAVAAGVALRCFNKSDLSILAKTVYNHIFSSGSPPPHILLREYARTVLEKAHQWQALSEDFVLDKFRSPFKSKWPLIKVTIEQIEKLENSKSYGLLCKALQLQSEGGYKNFGHNIEYIIQRFNNIPLNKTSLKNNNEDNNYDVRIAKRYIFKRVTELGWKKELFPDDDTLFEDERPEVESIRQKYQRIALHEFLAFLSDHYHLNPAWYDEFSAFEGSWQIRVNDFDPSLVDETEKRNNNSLLDCWWCRYPNPLISSSRQSHEDWMFQEDVSNLLPLLSTKEPSNKQHWLTLTGNCFWDEPVPYNKSDRDHIRRNVWIHIRSWLVKKGERDQFVNSIKSKHFYGKGIILDESSNGWLGNYPWSKSHSFIAEACSTRSRDWLQGDTTSVIATACQITEKSLLVPSPQVLDLLNAHWSGEGLKFINSAQNIVALNPASFENKPRFVLVDFNLFLKSISAQNLSIVWTVIGERNLYGGDRSNFSGCFSFSGVYWVKRGKIFGGVTQRRKDKPRRFH